LSPARRSIGAMSDPTNPNAAPVTWFEIGTGDVDAAKAFYGDVFGWTFRADGPYTLVTTTGPGPVGGIQPTGADHPAGAPATYAIPCIQVKDVAATCAAAETAGGKVVIDTTSAPDGLTFAQLTDPAGALIGVWTPPAG
jgi:uncharacterized protein